MLLQELSPFTCTLGTILPKICAFAEPIVAILADSDVIVVPQNALADSFVAAVMAEDE
jgi:hypothetical protein